MTGRESIELILQFFSDYNRKMDDPLTERKVWPILCDVINEYAKNGMLENMKLGDPNVPSQYVIPFYDVPIYKDPKRNLCYSNIPATPINLPFRRGMQLVCPMKNMNRRVIICNLNELPSAARSGAKNAESQITGWVEGKRLYYGNAFSNDNAPKMLFEIIVSGYGSVDMDMELPVDPAMSQKIRQEVIDYFEFNLNRHQDFTKDMRSDG